MIDTSNRWATTIPCHELEYDVRHQNCGLDKGIFIQHAYEKHAIPFELTMIVNS